MAAAETRRRGGFLSFLRDLLIILLVAFVASFLLKTFLVRSFYIPSGSMENTLQVNDRILVNQLVPALSDVKRGDIVVFEDPGGWLYPESSPADPTVFERVLQTVGLAAETSNRYVVKRVIGIGGDRVQCCDADGRVMVNGVSIDEPYLKLPDDTSNASGIEFDVVVPAGAVWVMGDNRYASKDSRYNQDQPGKGFVLDEEIVGRAFLLNWPFDRFSWIHSHENVFTGVDEARAAE